MYNVLLLCLATLGIARQIPINEPSPSSTSTPEPCALISAASAAYLAASPTVPAAIVDGNLYHECLKSIPIDTSAAISLLHSLEPYIELQSTLPFLADPPASYPFPTVDIQQSLRDLITDVSKGKYFAEYDFQTDLYRLFLSARDGHFSFIPDLFGVGSFKIPGAALVSISTDGVESPEVFLRSDVLDLPEGNGPDSNIAVFAVSVGQKGYPPPSPVTRINNISTLEYLSARTLDHPYHDHDAAYNFLFSEVAQIIQFGSAGDGAFPNPTFYPGRETVIELANGTTLVIPTVAELRADFDGVHDGSSAYNAFCLRDVPNWTEEPLPSTDSSSPVPEIVIPFYPPPIIQDPSMRVAGFFLNNDTAVLTILNFASPATDQVSSLTTFQSTIDSFLKQCQEAGRTRLIIDLFANGGGVVELGLNTFAQLFPGAEPMSHGNMRASQVLYDLGREVSIRGTKAGIDSEIGQDAYDVRSTLKVDGSEWAGGWDELFGDPGFRFDSVESTDSATSRSKRMSRINEMAFTNIFQSNISVSAPPGFQFSTPSPLSPGTRAYAGARPVFEAANILILTDGYCASTCAIFFELLRREGARSVVVGGRPRAAESLHGPTTSEDIPAGRERMQALGTTKGRAFWSFKDLLIHASPAADTAQEVNRDIEGEKKSQMLTDLPLRRTLFPESAGVNGVNHLRLPRHDEIGIDDGHKEEGIVPLQFIRDEADFHLFFTREMLVDKSVLWDRVVESTLQRISGSHFVKGMGG